MRELSLNVMDIVQNSISAGAGLIEITQLESQNNLTVSIKDNGCGMTEEQIQSVTNPFFTTRTTRDVGLGVPLFKMACEQTGGSFSIESELGKGTTTSASFNTSHIDMTPVGDMDSTLLLLITCNPEIDFVYVYKNDNTAANFVLDTRELKEILGDDVSLSNPDVTAWLKDYLAEQPR